MDKRAEPGARTHCNASPYRLSQVVPRAHSGRRARAGGSLLEKWAMLRCRLANSKELHRILSPSARTLFHPPTTGRGAGCERRIAMSIMKNAHVSSCANPRCEKKFKRLGEGKLFVRPTDKKDSHNVPKALWLCPECALLFDLRYDRVLEEYSLVRRRDVA